jgi:Ni/Fe-hydrogenase 1 B-type cytochrome subunit
MGRIRFIHFAAAAVFVMTGIVRAYWLFAGNRFERLPALFPVTPTNLKNLFKTGVSYLTFRPEKQPRYIGHNPLAQNGYTAVYVMAIIMVVTGFTLYGQSNPGGMIFRAFAWVSPLVGGLQRVRLIHHALTWAFLIFIVFHVYFALRADYIERVGVISSIITGGRYVTVDETYEDFDVEKVPSRPWPTGEYPLPRE